MAEKRMFTQRIIDSDSFLDMPLSTQALYFHLNMRADDDGFINNPKRIVRTIGANIDDLKLLVTKRFVICFESGVIVIKHWRMHNTLQNDRYKPTQYQEELETLRVKSNKSYTEKEHGKQMETKCQPLGSGLDPERIQNGSTLDPQYSIDQYSNIYSPAEQDGAYKKIVDYLNKRTGKHFKESTKKTRSLIHARMKEGYTISDFKQVIDTKTVQWKGTEQDKYLRPETLFGTKFEGYLNETPKTEDSAPKMKELN